MELPDFRLRPKCVHTECTEGEQDIDQVEFEELAAFTAVCSLLINLDETITRE